MNRGPRTIGQRFLHELRSPGRALLMSPDAWRCVGRYAKDVVSASLIRSRASGWRRRWDVVSCSRARSDFGEASGREERALVFKWLSTVVPAAPTVDGNDEKVDKALKEPHMNVVRLKVKGAVLVMAGLLLIAAGKRPH